MTEMLRRFRRAVASFAAEDRPEFKRVDASPALYDDGSWLTKLVADAQLERLPEERREAARVDIEAISAAMLGAAEALARWWLRTDAMPAADAAELLVRTIEQGLMPRA